MCKKLFSDDQMKEILVEIDDKLPKEVRFKPYETGENYVFPPTTDEYIPKNHITRLLNIVVDRMDITDIYKTYKGGGSSAYNPRMLLKVWLLGFIYRIYTSRKLDIALKENLPFIWISGNQTPDFRTLNNFRLKLKDGIKKLFKQIVLLGIQMGIIEGKDVFVDHTKIEANANKHKVVWRKQVENQIGKIDRELDELFLYIEKLNDEEDKKYRDRGIKANETRSYDIEDINNMIKKLEGIINEKEKNKSYMNKEEIRESRTKLKRTYELFNRKAGYNLKKQVLGDRNSYSRTDPSATAMMQKDKLSIKPSYNEGIAVENGFVLNYVHSENSADNTSFKELVDGTTNNIGKEPENIHADAAYGNEENSEYLEEKGIKNYLKFNLYRKEKSKKWHREKVRKEDFKYVVEGDYYICPAGAKLFFHEEKINTTATGYNVTNKVYKAEEGKCENCVYREYCTTSNNRSISISEKYERHKETMRKNLSSEKGKELRKRRGFEVESVFGDRKFNRKYHRFVLRGKEKVFTEAGLNYISHNIRKIYKFIIINWYKSQFGGNILKLCEI